MASAEELFTQALRLSSDDRTAWLQEACGGDAALIQRVSELLAAQEELDSQFLEAPAGELHETFISPVAEGPGTEIGPYKLREQLGEGGMGVVFVADQKEPVKRRVALKIIKPGMDSAQVVARFEAERQAVAMMDHPGIARVLDAGTTATGRPYFAMELVKGLPISQYCDEHQLSPRERLELFVPVCQAVQHAHQKGVVHRDIKPSNILVAEYDDKPVPMIIDFGIAKALHAELTEKTVYTQYGQLIGTLEYMSPEQAKLNQLDVDTRSDVYSLGVVLYELLTGTTPLTKEELRSVGYDEMLRMIRETDAPRPSTRLTQSTELPAISANRRSAPQKLGAIMKGELDWIVMKALEKDRTRRYGSASDFGDDIQRYLNDETVEACPPSAAYRFSKFVRRNRATAATVALLTGAVLIAAVGASIGYFRLQHALVVERDARAEEKQARDRALASKKAAVESEHAATEALERLKESQEAERRSSQENALLHASEVTRAIEGLRQREPLALHTAANVLKNLPNEHPASGRLSNQIEWELLCSPKLIHRIEIPQNARFGIASPQSVAAHCFVIRGEQHTPPWIRLLGGTRRPGFNQRLRALTEIRLCDPNTGQPGPVTLKGRFRKLLDDPDHNRFVTVDWKRNDSDPEVVRFWDVSSGADARAPIRLEDQGRVIGTLRRDILLTYSQLDGTVVIKAVQGTQTIAETEIQYVDNPKARKQRRDVHDNYVIRDLGNGSFQIQYFGAGESFSGLGQLDGNSLRIVAIPASTRTSAVASADGGTFAVVSETVNGEITTRETIDVDSGGQIQFWNPATLEPLEQIILAPHGTGSASLSLSEDGRVLLVTKKTQDSPDNEALIAEIWDVKKNRRQCRLETDPDNRFVLSRDGRFIARAEGDVDQTEDTERTYVTVCRSANGRPIGAPVVLPGRDVAFLFSRDSSHLLTVYETPDDDKNHLLQAWKIPGLETTHPLPTSGIQRAMAFSSAGELLSCQSGGPTGVWGIRDTGYLCKWNVRGRTRSRIFRCEGAGLFGRNTFGGKTDCALSVSVHDGLQVKFHLWNMLDGKPLRPPIVPSTRLIPPSTVRVTPNFLFWKTAAMHKVAFDLKTGKELPITVSPRNEATAQATLCTDDGRVHYQIRRGNVERIEFNGQEFINGEPVPFTGIGPSRYGRKYFEFVGSRLLFSTDSGIRSVDTESLQAEQPFLSLGDRETEILAADALRNRIAVHNRAGYITVIDVDSGRPLFQRIIEPGTTWELACFNPETGDLVYRTRNGGLISQYPVPEPPEQDADGLLRQVETETGIRVTDDGLLAGVEPHPSRVLPSEFLATNLSKAVHCYRRFRYRAARLHADRHLGKQPDDWLALLIRAHSARVSGDPEAFQNDIERALSIAESTDSIGQALPWLQDMAYRQFLSPTNLSNEERLNIASDYIDLIAQQPDSRMTLTMLLETAHAQATVNEYSAALSAIESKAKELGLNDLQFRK